MDATAVITAVLGLIKVAPEHAPYWVVIAILLYIILRYDQRLQEKERQLESLRAETMGTYTKTIQENTQSRIEGSRTDRELSRQVDGLSTIIEITSRKDRDQ